MNAVIRKDKWVLVNEKTGLPVVEGDVVIDFRGEAETVKGGRPPHKPSSSGFVWVSSGSEYYPSVYDLKWVRE